MCKQGTFEENNNFVEIYNCLAFGFFVKNFWRYLVSCKETISGMILVVVETSMNKFIQAYHSCKCAFSEVLCDLSDLDLVATE